MTFNISLTEKLRIVYSYLRFKITQCRLRTSEYIFADTKYGKVKGVKWHTIYGDNTYYSFEGIPFARPPLGELRFKAPVEPKPWRGYRLCTHTRSKPLQYNPLFKLVQGSEDCLYLNVYTKELNPAKPMPVLVWIFGGGFQVGEISREIYSPDYIMMENVVLVTVAYRLGPLGFLSLGDEDCGIPGNAGLKDQVLSLKWVKNNCHFFGGDSENITVFGTSAGAISVQFFTITEQAKNLFHKAILLSGSVLLPWTIVPTLDMAYRLAVATGYKGENKDKDVLHYLKKLNTTVMCKVADNLLTIEEVQNEGMIYAFVPCVEPYKTEHCVIDKKPLEMLKNNWGNNIPLLVSCNSFEGLVSFPQLAKFPYLINNFVENFLLPVDANIKPEKRLKYSQAMKQMYFDGKTPTWENILQFCDLSSYKYCWHSAHRILLARRQYATAPTFLQRFDFDSEDFNMARILMCGRTIRGTCHADEQMYIFYTLLARKLSCESAEYKTIRRLVKILVKFAEHGDPNLALEDPICWSSLNSSTGNDNDNDTNADDVQHQYWPSITDCDDTKPFKCLNISNKLSVIDLPEAEKLKFWDEMYEDKSLLY